MLCKEEIMLEGAHDTLHGEKMAQKWPNDHTAGEKVLFEM